MGHSCGVGQREARLKASWASKEMSTTRVYVCERACVRAQDGQGWWMGSEIEGRYEKYGGLWQQEEDTLRTKIHLIQARVYMSNSAVSKPGQGSKGRLKNLPMYYSRL